MQGIITFVSGGEIAASQYLKEVQDVLQETSSAGVRILQWLSKHNRDLDALRMNLSRVTMVDALDIDEIKALNRQGNMPYRDVGTNILDILLYVPGDIWLEDVSAVARMLPNQFRVYEINMDTERFTTYRNATIHSVAPGGWSVKRYLTGVYARHQPTPHSADATSFHLDDLPSVDKYLKFWQGSEELCDGEPSDWMMAKAMSSKGEKSN